MAANYHKTPNNKGTKGGPPISQQASLNSKPYKRQRDFLMSHMTTCTGDLLDRVSARALQSAIKLARRITLTRKYLASTIEAMSTLGHISAADASAGSSPEVLSMRRQIKSWFKGSNSIVFVDQAITAYAMVPKGPPIRIYVRADVVMMAGNMLKKYGKGHAVYRRALLHLAVIVAHEYQHALRMCLEGVLEDTPSKIIGCGMPTTEKTKNGVTYKTGEGGWWWESQVIGGELVSRPHVTETEGVTLLPLALQSFAGDGEWWEVPDKTIENICTKASHWTDLLPIMPGTANVTRGTVPGARLRRTSVNDIDHASQIHIGRMPGPRPRTCGYHDLPTLGIPNLDPKRPNFHKRFASPEEWESSVKTELD